MTNGKRESWKKRRRKRRYVRSCPICFSTVLDTILVLEIKF